MTKRTNRLTLYALLASVALLTACGDGNDAPVVEQNGNEQLSGEILERSVTDEMLPTGEVGAPSQLPDRPATLSGPAPEEAEDDAATTRSATSRPATRPATEPAQSDTSQPAESEPATSEEEETAPPPDGEAVE